MELDLEAKTAIVTGGSRGIGKAIARALAKEGADIALVARNLVVARNAADEIAQASGRKIRSYCADTGNNEMVQQSMAEIARDFGHIDILINCAAQPGGQGPPPAFSAITSEDFYADMNVKVMGYLRCAQAVVPHMMQGGWGRIINISGLAARETGSIIGSMRNIAVAALTKNLADDLGPYGINVTCVHPGLTRTEKTREVVQRKAVAAGISAADMEQRMTSENTIRRFVDAADIAALVAFLASPKSIAINGESIGAGGGIPGVIHY
jgi:NAD(P)-dependent dehydrogenase (short-subunit alcohol dehydrogenase family)